jgi:hypothetical protein
MIFRRFKTIREKHVDHPNYPHLKNLQKFSSKKRNKVEHTGTAPVFGGQQDARAEFLSRLGANKRIQVCKYAQ